MRRAAKAAVLGLALLAAAGCQRGSQLAPPITALTPATHTRFPIMSGVHAASCNTCHGDFGSFTQFSCIGCHAHDQPVTDELHRSLVTVSGTMPNGSPGYTYSSSSCLQCHATGARVAFDHAGVTSACATCHDSGAPFDPLPVPGIGLDGKPFIHPDKAGNDCRACHTTVSWLDASGAPEGMHDPAQDSFVTAQLPSYSGTSITSFTAQQEDLPMPMSHRSQAVPSGTSCVTCHADANSGLFFPGRLHASLTTQPTTCLDCHATSMPTGFVGPTVASPGRTPPSGEMKHDAVLWSGGKPTQTAAIAQECSTCHQAPPASQSWVTTQKLHASLSQQPSSCLDCHANSRPATLLTSANAALPAGLSFDHTSGAATGECTTCHTAGATQFTSWAGGRFHLPGSATPSTCLPCHEGERPSFAPGTTPPWISATYSRSPFDYGGYSSPPVQFTHGNGLDCVACHANPGLAPAVWGGTGTQQQNWAKGFFDHAASGSAAASTCVACHSTQRPTSPITQANGLPFDHSQNGTGDCIGCHQNTITTIKSYVNYPGDWAGGVGYPGSTLVSSPLQVLAVSETTLNPAPPRLVTSTTTINATQQNPMLHDDPAVLPPSLYPGVTSNPDYTKCYQCHTQSNTKDGSPYGGGQWHPTLTRLSLAQPTSHCADCHSQTLPTGIVFRGGSELQPMDHNAAFASATQVTSNGAIVSVTNVNQIDCSTCHKNPGNAWNDGTFHKNIGTGVPADCTVCHYTLMADAVSSDVTSTTNFAMKHKSPQLTFQNCQLCHTTALANSTGATLAATQWKPGAFHASLATQPSSCTDCHAVSEPKANASTQSSVTYVLAAGGTSTNGAQWMNHGSTSVAGKDCVSCHASDARTSGSAWSKSDSYHAAVASPVSCQECHGFGNGGGTVVGTNNNMPSGLTSSTTVTSAASDSTTGVPAGTLDQVNHADVNVTSHDCNFCHTQAGPSTVAGVQGKEWTKASFHAAFSTASPLVMNGTTGRCSNCHMNVKPASTFPLYDHTSLTNASGSQDCASCHTYPGTGTASAPNWLGAAAVPDVVTLTPWTSGAQITSSTVTFSHPRPNTYTSCAQCHPNGNTKLLVDFNHDGMDSNVTINGVAVTTAPNQGQTQYNATTNPTFCVHCHNSKSPWMTTTGRSSTITANTTSGSTTVLTASSTALTLGMTVTGSGIPTTTSTGTALTVTITSIPSSTSFVISSAANATVSGTTLTVTHKSIAQFAIGNHGGSTAPNDCTSCHYVRSGTAKLTPPTAGVFGSGSISGN